MAKLTAARRKALPKSEFAVPGAKGGKGAYPIPDMSHARNALARVSGNGSPKQKAQVKKAVKKKFPGIKQKRMKAKPTKAAKAAPTFNFAKPYASR